jgi:KUP system potassium uptake protein
MLDKGNRIRPAGIGVILGVVGIVFGDIGTSPLYAVQTVFSIGGGAFAPMPGLPLGLTQFLNREEHH